MKRAGNKKDNKRKKKEKSVPHDQTGGIFLGESSSGSKRPKDELTHALLAALERDAPGGGEISRQQTVSISSLAPLYYFNM